MSETKENTSSVPNGDTSAKAAVEVQPSTDSEVKPVEVKKPVDKVSAAFAKLSRKEKELIEKEKTFKQREEKLIALEQLEKDMDTDFLAVAKKKGWDFERLAKAELEKLDNKSKDPEVKALADKMKAIEEKEARMLESEREKANEAGIKRFEDDLKAVIADKVDDFEYCSIKGDKALKLALEIVNENYLKVKQATGKEEVLSPQEALELAEQYYEEEAAELVKAKKSEKHRPVAKKEDEEFVKKIKDVVTKTSTKTLSNAMDGESSSTIVKPKTEAERKALAKQALRGL